MLRERNETQKSTYHMVPFIWSFRTGKTNLRQKIAEQCLLLGGSFWVASSLKELPGMMRMFCVLIGVK